VVCLESKHEPQFATQFSGAPNMSAKDTITARQYGTKDIINVYVVAAINVSFAAISLTDYLYSSNDYISDLWSLMFLLFMCSFMIYVFKLVIVDNAVQAEKLYGWYLFALIIWFSCSILSLIGLFAGRYSRHGLIYLEPQVHTISHNISDALYFSVTTWTTLGLGDFIPATRGCRYWVAGEALVGYSIMALAVLALIAMLRSDDTSQKS